MELGVDVALTSWLCAAAAAGEPCLLTLPSGRLGNAVQVPAPCPSRGARGQWPGGAFGGDSLHALGGNVEGVNLLGGQLANI